MDYVYIGKIVNTHGIKGEVRILSNFEILDVYYFPNTHNNTHDSKSVSKGDDVLYW